VTETFDANGCVVLAGGIDIHSHIAGEPLALLRDAKSPAGPTASRTGGEYAHMGYTLAVNRRCLAGRAAHDCGGKRNYRAEHGKSRLGRTKSGSA
jgi:formylmethanofuran dehydrogenase subunit A